MTFQNQLNDYILQARCSSKELATASGLSEGTISRYRKGYRVPGIASEQVSALASGLYSLLNDKDPQITKEHILTTLRDSIGNGLVISYDVYIKNLKQLLRSFEISNIENSVRSAKTGRHQKIYRGRCCIYSSPESRRGQTTFLGGISGMR